MAISLTYEKGFYIIDAGGPILRYPASHVEITTNEDDVVISPVSSDSRRAKVIRANYVEFTSPSGASAEAVALAIFQLNEGVDVNLQSNTTPPLDPLFVEALSNFTISTDAVASGETTMVYTFEATAGHGIIIGDEIILLDVVADRYFQAEIVNVATNTITIDRPIDHAFASASTLGRITNSNMNVLGSLASPRIFTLNGGINPSDFSRFIITITDDTAMDDSRFGGLSALSNGLVFRIYNGFQRTIFNFKSNQDIKQFCYDVNYSDKAPAGIFGLSARITFGGEDKHGTIIRAQTPDVIQWVVQDDLTGLLTLRGSATGSETTGESLI